MASVRVEKRIGAPPERVFAIRADLRNIASVVRGITAIEVLTEGPVGVGTRWRETRTMFGKAATEEMRVAGFDPPRSFLVEAESHGTRYRSEYAFEPDGDGTRVTMTFTGTPLTLFARVMSIPGRLMTSSVRRMLEADLADVGTAAEAAGDDPRAGQAPAAG